MCTPYLTASSSRDTEGTERKAILMADFSVVFSQRRPEHVLQRYLVWSFSHALHMILTSSFRDFPVLKTRASETQYSIRLLHMHNSQLPCCSIASLRYVHHCVKKNKNVYGEGGARGVAWLPLSKLRCVGKKCGDIYPVTKAK